MIGTSRQLRCRTRFAPSPTGSMHVGNLRTAFYAYALAKHEGGDFILRIEDTDKKREVEGGVDDIKDLLTIFNVKWDEYYIQSERLELYKKAAEKLVADGHAFYCQCEAKNAKEDGFSNELRDPCREKGLTSGAIKLKTPENEWVTFKDYVIQKKVSWNTSVVGDATLLKTDGFPTYHLAVVVDDNDMEISHVLRGHDWMPSTPIHLLVYKYLGFEVPEIGHLTDIMDPEGGKLSKRKGSTSVRGLLKEGYLSEAIFNFVILLGWAPKDNRELFTLEDFVKNFDPNGFQKGNPVFNREKLDWFNGEYIRKLSDEDLFDRVSKIVDKTWDPDKVRKMIPLAKDRMKRINDFISLAGFVFEERKPMILTNNLPTYVGSATPALMKIDDWNLENINNALMGTVQSNGFKTGDFFMGLRGAIAGSKVTPPLNESIEVLGKDGTLNRLKKVT
ncbi:MAG TPA: glutamate--tRNA ligase [Patescibacteria group bacterium]|nr:glutamate--tRNA ligase [Patescibacteria group bacterium]